MKFILTNKIGLFFCHQGFTDIINCCALIKFYRKYYDELYILMRDDMKDFFDFFISNDNNIIISYIPKPQIDLYFQNLIIDNDNIDRLFHGFCVDWKRKIKYIDNPKLSFSENFYYKYNLDYDIRYKYFNFDRNHKLEEELYNKVNPNNEPYVLIHADPDRNINLNIETEYKIINLNMISSIMFDTIKLLENAKEIHCIDSVWGCLIYIIDMKYNLFNHINIYFHCVRGYDFFFKPLKQNHHIK